MSKLLRGVLVAGLMSSGCTRANPAVCCESEADCNSIGVTDSARVCALGLVCSDHQCVLPPDAPTPECTTEQDCGVLTPYCAPALQCVQCLDATHCPTSSPTCDEVSRTCRGCALDAECSSGLCAVETGLCVDEATVAYASPTGSNTAQCTRIDPCSIQRAFAITDIVRDTVKLNPGAYTASITIANKTVNVRGEGATVSSTAGGTFTVNDRGVLRASGLIIVNSETSGFRNAVVCESLNQVDQPTLELTGVQVEALRYAVYLYKCNATISESRLHTTTSGSSLFADAATATVTRTSILGGSYVVASGNGALVKLTNSVVGNPTSGNDAFYSLGGAIHVSFSTVVNALGRCGTGAAQCSGGAFNGICYENSIVANLAPAAPADSITGSACTASYTLVFPQSASVAGSNNKLGMNPLLKDPANGDFHLAPGSPAIDSAGGAAQPLIDFDGIARPQGAGSDMGAFEFQP